MESEMQMPQPGAQHEQLSRLAGTWKGAEQMHPSPWDPTGGPAEGLVENRVSLNDFVVIHNYTQTRNGEVSFVGHGVYSWNAFSEQFEMHWWDSMGFPPNVFSGTFEGDVLRLQFAGQDGHHRAVMDLSVEGQYSFSMDVSPDGEKWTPFMTGVYKKQ